MAQAAKVFNESEVSIYSPLLNAEKPVPCFFVFNKCDY